MSAPDRIWVMFGRRGELEPAVNPGEKPADEVLSHFFEYTRATSEADALREAHGKLWSALAEIVEARTASPNATVRRLIGMAEDALIDDPIAEIKPVPEFGRHAAERDRAALAGDA